MAGNAFSTLVFDIGGSHATASLVCDDSFELHSVTACPLTPEASKEALLDSLEQLAREVLADANVSIAELNGIGFAMPGPFDYELGISYMRHKHPSLYGVSVRQELASRLGILPTAVTFINDAAAFLLGEISAGAARNARRVLGITLGTGVGSGFAVDGAIVMSGPGVPPGGEIWNVKWEQGIVEDVISTRAIQGIYHSLTGETMQVRDIALRCANEDSASETFRRFGSNFGAVLRSIAEDFRPDLVVIGGAIARSASLFLPATQETFRRDETKIVVSQLFENAALVGAGANWMRSARLTETR